MIIYINGDYVPQEEARVSVLDRGYLYGDGVFEGIRAYNGRVFKLEEHIDRLFDSAHVLLLDIPLTPEELTGAVLETCRRNAITDGYIRIVVSRGVGDLGLDPNKCKKSTVVIIADRIQLYPEELYRSGMKIMTVPTRRNHHEALNPRLKSLNYLNNIMAKIEANLLGYNEVLMLSQEGYVAEGSSDNVFIVKDGCVITPPTFMGALKGITRDVVMELAAARGASAREEIFTRFEVYTADECFLTGTACEVIPVTECDGRRIGGGDPGPITREIISDFQELRQREGTPIPGGPDTGGDGT